MDRIIKANYPIIREVLPRSEARERLLAEGETFKVEVLDGAAPARGRRGASRRRGRDGG